MKNSVWPPPVYEGTFADGSVLRMSFHQKAGKPIDFARGRRLLAASGRTLRVPIKGTKFNPRGQQFELKQYDPAPLISGVVCIGDETHIDPMTDAPAPKVKKPSMADAVKRALRSLESGDAAAAISLLRAAVA